MRSRVISLALSLIVSLSLVLSACAKQEPPAPAETAPTAAPAPTEAKWWDKFGKPQYGGELTIAANQLHDSFDLFFPMDANFESYEQLFMWDLTIDREEWSFKVMGYPPKYKGLLAETWEWSDPQTLVVHLRHGVKWHNRPPTNGREFTADDVVYHYDRIMGTGSGFTEPSPMMAHFLDPVASVSAEDKYTVVFKFKEATPLNNWWTIGADPTSNMIEPREFVELGKPAEWQSCAGTGPFMVTDFIAGNSLTMSKNPDYYLYDERYPDNRLPYLDTLKMILILDPSTQVAAIRSGQVDLLPEIDWETAQNLGKTNPELAITSRPFFGFAVDLRCDKKPFDDIRVRKALQLAIDTQTIARTHFGGTVSGNPPGLVSTEYKGWTLPYEQWPEDLQQEYSYNPTEAKKLLADAGYPNGFDTNCYIDSSDDVDLLQIIQSYFADIGVNMTINTMGHNEYFDFTMTGKPDQMYSNQLCNMVWPINTCFIARTSKAPLSQIHADEAVYDDLYQQFVMAPDEATGQKLMLQAEDYALRQHWAVVTTGRVKFGAAQPYLKGFSGEDVTGFARVWFYPRFWIDQE